MGLFPFFRLVKLQNGQIGKILMLIVLSLLKYVISAVSCVVYDRWPR